jgi:GNAT superfamily N-acetyltransferase
MTMDQPGNGARSIEITPCRDPDLARALLVGMWGDDCLVIAGRAHSTRDMEVLCARGPDGDALGFAYYIVKGTAVLIGSIIVTEPRAGVGGALFQAVKAVGRERQLQTLRASTTNDNFTALLFYQRLGMRLSALYPSAADAFRALKPGLRTHGQHGLPVHDIIELEMRL